MPPPPPRLAATDSCGRPRHYWTMKMIRRDKLFIAPPPPFFISITSQRDPWKPVALSTACGGARLFHSEHSALTRRTWHVRLIMPGASDPSGRRAYPSHPWLRPKASRSGAPRSPERDGARSLPSGRLFSLMCLRFAATPKKKSNPPRECGRSRERRRLCWRQWCKKLQYITVSVEVWLQCFSVRGEDGNFWSVCLGCAAQFWHVHASFLLVLLLRKFKRKRG